MRLVFLLLVLRTQKKQKLCGIFHGRVRADTKLEVKMPKNVNIAPPKGKKYRKFCRVLVEKSSFCDKIARNLELSLKKKRRKIYFERLLFQWFRLN